MTRQQRQQPHGSLLVTKAEQKLTLHIAKLFYIYSFSLLVVKLPFNGGQSASKGFFRSWNNSSKFNLSLSQRASNRNIALRMRDKESGSGLGGDQPLERLDPTNRVLRQHQKHRCECGRFRPYPKVIFVLSGIKKKNKMILVASKQSVLVVAYTVW